MAYIESVIVTGACGRIGRDLLPRLRQSRFRVRGLDREAPDDGDLIRCDLGDPAGLREAFRGVHAVVHLAGQSWECDFDRELQPDNLTGCVNVFEAASAAGVRRVIFASTTHVLGDPLDEGLPADESAPPRPDTLYAVSKLFGENLGRYYADTRGMSVLCARIGWYLRDDDERLRTDPVAQALWVSARDLEHFLVESLAVRDVHFEILNCTSDNRPPRLPLDRAREVIGYRPRDGIERDTRSASPRTMTPPIVVVGSIRSGTTLLAQCLASHPAVRYLPFEQTRDWRELAGIHVSTSATDDPSCPAYAADHLDAAAVEAARRGFVELAKQAGVRPGTRWVLKNPHLWNKLALVRRIFPEATIVVACRDLRGTVASMKRLWRDGHELHGTRYHLPVDPTECWTIRRRCDDDESRSNDASTIGDESNRTYPEAGVALLAEYWLRTYEEIERFGQAAGNVVRILHRDLVSDSMAALAPVYDAIGVGPADLGHDLEPRDGLARYRLTADEQQLLDRFEHDHRARIQALGWTDTTR